MNLSDIAPPATCPVPRRILDEAETLTTAFETTVQRFPDFEGVILLDRNRSERRISLGELWTRAKDIQAALTEHGVRHGACVVLILPTGADLVAAYFGTMMAGGIPAVVATPSNRLVEPRAYTHLAGAILHNGPARVVYCEQEIEDLLRDSEGALPENCIILKPADVPKNSKPLESVKPEPDSYATLQYSSGSTGAPKGVLLVHRAMVNNIRALRDGLKLRNDEVSVNWAPLYHDMGLIDTFLLPFLCGCPTVLIPTQDFMREPALWLWAIHHYRGAVSWAPNLAYALCARRIPDRELEGLDLSCWRVAVSGGEPALAGTVTEFTQRFAEYGFRSEATTPVYGLAENVTAVTVQPVDEAPPIDMIDRHEMAASSYARPVDADGFPCVSIGRPLPPFEVEIRAADRQPLAERQIGNIWVRSNSLFSGYHRDPEATRKVLVDGWLDTEDQGYVANGYVFFVSREKDLIIIGGEKYAPDDVEAAINRVPGVREGCAIAFGVMNQERGTQELAAVVETREQDADRRETLRSAIRMEVTLAIGQPIRHLELVPPGGIEKTTSGKLARRATRARYADEFDGGH